MIGHAWACLFHFSSQLGVPLRAFVPESSKIRHAQARPRPAQVNHCLETAGKSFN